MVRCIQFGQKRRPGGSILELTKENKVLIGGVVYDASSSVRRPQVSGGRTLMRGMWLIRTTSRIYWAEIAGRTMGAHGMRSDARPGLDDAGGAHVPEEYDAGAALAELRQGIDDTAWDGCVKSTNDVLYLYPFCILYFSFFFITNLSVLGIIRRS